MLNADIAAAFEEVADLLALQDANPFRVRAYRRAAQRIRTQPGELQDRVAAGFDPDDLPGVGPDLAGKIRELLASGQMRLLERLRRGSPPGLRDLLRLPGLGPKRVQLLHTSLGVVDEATLRAAVAAHRVARAPGLGAALEARLARALATPLSAGHRHLRADALPRARRLELHLSAQPGVRHAVTAGSLRRGRDTVGDLDVVVVTPDPLDARGLLESYRDFVSIQSGGQTRASGTLRGGLQVDVRVVRPESLGAALVYFTGSKAHVLRLRRRAIERGLKINEYGVFRARTRLAGDTEESVHASIGLPLIPPELREDLGEIEAAVSGRLPALVSRAQLRGDLHVHSLASDGRASLEDMAAAARSRGLEYLGIADHADSLSIVKGLDASALAGQIDAIDALNALHDGITLLKSAEVDVLEDGRLALPDAILTRLDFVIGAVHSRMTLPRRQQTRRLLRALDNRCLSIIAHPTGRLVPDRPPIEADWPAVFRRAAERPCFLEINAQAARLDLTDTLARSAAECGALLCLNTDAHDVGELDLLDEGVMVARRGWLEPAHVVNTRPLSVLRRLLATTMQ